MDLFFLQNETEGTILFNAFAEDYDQGPAGEINYNILEVSRFE